MKPNEDRKKRGLALVAYVICVILSILLFSTSRSGGGTGKGGGGNGGGTGTSTGTETGGGSGGESKTPDKKDVSQSSGSNTESPATPANEGKSDANTENKETSNEPSSTEVQEIDLKLVKTDVTEDQKKIWKAAVDRTKKLCKFPEQSVFPDFGAKETEIILGKTENEIQCYKVKGFYVAPNTQGKKMKTCFECTVYLFQNDYITTMPEVSE